MKTIGIVAEFNPFHNGHLHLLNYCKKELGADYIVIVMSGDFVQRGSPALVDKFVRTKMALSCGADLVFELPVCYSTGSAEFFAQGAVSLLDKLGVVDQLVFGSECGDTSLLTEVANILVKEPDQYKEALSAHIKKGDSFPVAREKALTGYMKTAQDNRETDLSVLSSPNNILGIEYIKALLSRNSKIEPIAIKRIGEAYDSEELNSLSSASGIRSSITSGGISADISSAMPSSCYELLSENTGRLADNKRISDLLHYKLLQEKENGYSVYLDVSEDFSNKILSKLEKYESFDQFCNVLKSKDTTYSRISRSLTHILLGITDSNMAAYKEDGYTTFARVLGMKAKSSPLLREINKSSKPLLTNIKNAQELLSPLEFRMFKETLFATEIYNLACPSKNNNEYRLKQIIL